MPILEGVSVEKTKLRWDRFYFTYYIKYYEKYETDVLLG